MEEINIPVEEFKTALLEINRIKATEIFDSIYSKNGNYKVLEHLTMEALERIGAHSDGSPVSS